MMLFTDVADLTFLHKSNGDFPVVNDTRFLKSRLDLSNYFFLTKILVSRLTSILTFLSHGSLTSNAYANDSVLC